MKRERINRNKKDFKKDTEVSISLKYGEMESDCVI